MAVLEQVFWYPPRVLWEMREVEGPKLAVFWRSQVLDTAVFGRQGSCIAIRHITCLRSIVRWRRQRECGRQNIRSEGKHGTWWFHPGPLSSCGYLHKARLHKQGYTCLSTFSHGCLWGSWSPTLFEAVNGAWVGEGILFRDVIIVKLSMLLLVTSHSRTCKQPLVSSVVH